MESLPGYDEWKLESPFNRVDEENCPECGFPNECCICGEEEMEG